MIQDKLKYTAYLIGSICHAKDRAKAFDASERAVLEAGHTALNPVKEEPEKTGMDCDKSEDTLKAYWREGKFEDYRNLMNAIWIKDLENIRKADYLVLHFEEGDNSVGAPLEMTIASLPYLMKLAKKSCDDKQKAFIEIGITCLEKAGFFHKPIYWVCTGPISEINSTLKALVLWGSDIRVFKTYSSLTDFLKENYK